MNENNKCIGCDYSMMVPDHTGELRRFCHRYPPQMVVIPQPKGTMIQPCFPVVGANDSCGEFKSKLVVLQ